MTGPRIVVVGSCSLDRIITGARFPGPGETVSADALVEEPGGKGLNQALAAARSGGGVTFVGACGDDAAGLQVREVLAGAGVRLDGLRVVPGPTGAAYVFVDAYRENRIVILAGANAALTALTDADRAEVASADLLLLQLESPLSVVEQAAAVAAGAGVRVVLTPAPVRPLSQSLLADVALLMPNEPEALALTGCGSVDEALPVLLERVPAVLVTQGAAGSTYADRSGLRRHQPARAVEAVDTTGAGDVFAGGFAATWAATDDIAASMARASVAASLAVSRPGTSSAVPTGAEVDAVGG